MLIRTFFHIFGNGDFEHREHIGEHSFYANAKREPCLSQVFIAAVYPARVVEFMEQCRKIYCVARDFCGVVVLCRGNDFIRQR